MPEGTRLANTPKLAGRYVTEENWRHLDRLNAFCAARQRSLLELAFAWLLAEPTTASVIAGATRPGQVEANVNAARWTLSGEERSEVATILTPETSGG
jgi:aryl-alcohol dehydrogenase-like predicted oxidoreductase